MPGDVIAGYALAGGHQNPSLLAVCLASGLLYAAGLLFNDWFDREEDARDRPERPIPSGALNPRTVLKIAGSAIVLAVLIASLAAPTVGIIALILAMFILFYNGLARRHPIIGLPAMAGCRLLNLLLGAALVPHRFSSPVVLLSGGLLFLYILLVSIAALHEVERPPLHRLLASLGLFPVVVWLVLTLTPPPATALAWICWIFFTVATLIACKKNWHQKAPNHNTGAFIGELLRNLILFQATLTARGTAETQWIMPLLFLLLYSGATLAARRFHGS